MSLVSPPHEARPGGLRRRRRKQYRNQLVRAGGRAHVHNRAGDSRDTADPPKAMCDGDSTKVAMTGRWIGAIFEGRWTLMKTKVEIVRAGQQNQIERWTECQAKSRQRCC